ncbi:MAG: hypothetical protein RL693_1842 [Verrucomicrobiota bacterium]|jgi:hypothetical protein
MSDYNNNNGSGRSQGRGRGGRRPSSRGGNGSNNRNDDRGNFRPNRNKAPQQTGFQKFLSVVTFGLLGKPQVPAYAKPAAPQNREPREPGPIARGDRAEREASRGGERNKDRGDRGDRGSRPPRQAPISNEVTNDRLYVGNLSYDASESDLFELFNGAGRVKNAEVVVNNRTQRSKGFAFVTMMSIDEAKKAVAELNGKDFMGRPLVVGGAKPLEAREDRDSHDEQGAQHEESSDAEENKSPEMAA